MEFDEERSYYIKREVRSSEEVAEPRETTVQEGDKRHERHHIRRDVEHEEHGIYGSLRSCV